jgi:hypothetical protein
MAEPHASPPALVARPIRANEFDAWYRTVTEEYAADRKLVAVSRLYSMLSQTNEAIVRIRDVDELCAEACRVTVEFGQFVMAWIGVVDEENDTVRPVAHAGEERGYLQEIRVNVSDADEGQGPVGTAARLGRWEFMLTIAPPRAPGATGYPVNPLAMF